MKNVKYPLYETDNIDTIRELIYHNSKKYAEKPAYKIPKGKDKVESVSYNQVKSDAESLGQYLLSKGYNKTHISLIGENSYEWLNIYYSIVCSGNVAVPISGDLPFEEAKYIFDHSDSKVLFCSSNYPETASQFIEQGVNVISFDEIKNLSAKGLEIINSNENTISNLQVKPEQLCSILYTSGTTGSPKGVMLTHGNVAFNIIQCCKNNYPYNESMSILPFYHSFSLTLSILAIFHCGCPVYISKSVKYFSKDLQTVKPTFIFVVPMILERMYKTVWDTAKKTGKEKALKTLMKFSGALYRVGIDVRRKLFKSVLAAFGGNIDWISVGGAAVDPEIIKGFQAFGINVVNGYGLTECSPFVSSNRNDCNRIGSVGTLAYKVQAKIDSPDENGEGEILIKAPNVMIGYYKDDDSTREAFDGEWLKTGDIGYLDDEEFLFITGRKKNLIILNNGKNVCPEELELIINKVDYVQESVVYGENNALVAEVFLDTENYPDCANSLESDILEINRNLPSYKNIAKTKIRDSEFPKTASRKIKRNYK